MFLIEITLYASFLGFLIIVSIAFSACSPASNETPAASANASSSASDQTEARRQIEAAAIGIWQAVARGDSAAILAHYADDALILGPDPISWTVGMSCLCSSFSSLSKRVIDVDAVGISRSVRDFQTLWARSVRPQGWRRPHRLRRCKSFKIEARATTRRGPDVEN